MFVRRTEEEMLRRTMFLFIVAATAVIDASARDHAYKCVPEFVSIYNHLAVPCRDDETYLHQYIGEHTSHHIITLTHAYSLLPISERTNALLHIYLSIATCAHIAPPPILNENQNSGLGAASPTHTYRGHSTHCHLYGDGKRRARSKFLARSHTSYCRLSRCFIHSTTCTYTTRRGRNSYTTIADGESDAYTDTSRHNYIRTKVSNIASSTQNRQHKTVS